MKINARAKGHAFETKFCQLLRSFGFDAITSRSESKAYDDAGVDIITSAPFEFQLKAVERLNKSYHEILASMPGDKVRAVVHKRNNKGTTVTMTLEDFQNLHLDKGYHLEDMYP